MRKAVLLTTFDRTSYLEEVLKSWQSVRGREGWHLHVLMEPSEKQPEIHKLLEKYLSGWRSVHLELNPELYGVLHNPWVGFEQLFREEQFEFVVRIEDDLVVSDDILEFFSFQAEKWRDAHHVYTVLGFTEEDGPQDAYRLRSWFNPWIWGTWASRWFKRIGPSWDHDYSTFNGTPGNQSGWDWNLNTRIFPKDDACSVVPTASRVENIGLYGVHAFGSVDPAGGFLKARGKTSYREAEGREYD